MPQFTNHTGVIHPDPYVALVADYKGITGESAQAEMQNLLDLHGMSFTAYVDEEMFKYRTADSLEEAITAWKDRRAKSAAMVASSAGWTVEHALNRMQEVETRWPHMTFPVFLTHSLHLLTNDEIAEKAARWDISLEKRYERLAGEAGLTADWVRDDVLNRLAKFGLQSKYYACYRAWEVSDEELESYATRHEAKVLYTALNHNVEEVDDKLTFGQRFGDLMFRKSWTNRNTTLQEFLDFCDGLTRAFCKPADSDQGRGVYVLDLPQTLEELAPLYENLVAGEGLLLEQMIEQHEEVSRIYPDAVNTIRVLTVRVGDRVDIIAAAMRFGRKGNTDNFSKDGMASDVDLLTGKLATPAIDKMGTVHIQHPATGKKFAGFQIPMWGEVRELVTAAAMRAENNDFIGWDVAVCNDHVSLVEGNARPGTGLIQAPYSREHIGRDYVYEPYIKMLESQEVHSSVADQLEDFKFAVDDGTVVLTKYTGAKSVVHVPELTPNGPVRQIALGAFEGHSELRFVRLPNTITFIARNSFKDCSKLQGIYLGDSLRTIGTSAFEGCTSLNAVALPESLRLIRKRAFANSGLRAVVIPHAVSHIEARLFSGCVSLSRVVLPNNCTVIDDQAFSGCASLATLQHAFYNGVNKSGVRTYVVRDGLPTALTSLGEGAFAGCAELTKIRLPHGVRGISAHTFEDCTSLSNVELHNRLTAIDEFAFFGCDSLEELRIPYACRRISPTAFNALQLIVGSRSSAAAKFAKQQGIGFRAIRLENDDAPLSQMRPAGIEPVQTFYSHDALLNAIDHFEVRPSAVETTVNDVQAKAQFDLIDGVYSREPITEGMVRVMLVGDVLAKARQIRAARSHGRYDFDRQFRYVRNTLLNADLVIGSLETQLSPEYPYSDAASKVDATGYYNAPAELAHALKRAGFDAVVNANSHAYDLGVKGIFDTLESLNRAHLAHTGMYASSKDRRFEIFDIAGIRISLHSFMHDDIARDKLANFTVRGRNTLFSHASPESIRAELGEAKALGIDFSIVYCDWGRAGSSKVTEAQRVTASILADSGADLIVGTRSHLVQPFEWVQRSTGELVPCLWSAGDFITDTSGLPAVRRDSLILELGLTRNATGAVESRIRYRPCHIMNLAPGSDRDYVVLPCSQKLTSTAQSQKLTQTRFRLSTMFTGTLFPAELLPHEPQVRIPQSISQVDHRINAALDSLEHFEFPAYTRANYGEKRELDPVVMSQAAERAGADTLVASAAYHVYHRDGKLLPFHMHMSSHLTKLDRDATNNKDLTRRILEHAGVPIARGVLVKHRRELEAAFAEIGTPLVVKPEAGSFGRGVRLSIESFDELEEASLPILNSGQNVIVEEMFQGIDLRIAVVNGEARAATFRVPSNVVADGVSTIEELVEQKNAVRSNNDYISHQIIRFTPGIMEFLDKIGLSLDSVPPAGKRIFLHHVANISAGGDSYEVIDQIHPDLKDLAVRTAALFPSALHSGVDILAQALDQGLDKQRVIVCEVNMNNELPLHTNPVAGPPTPLNDIEFAIHWDQEARQEDIQFSSKAPNPPTVRAAEVLDALATITKVANYGDVPQKAIRKAEFDRLDSAMESELGNEATSRAAADGFVYVSDSSGEWTTEMSGGTVHPRAIARWHAIKAGLASALQIPYFHRIELLDATSEEIHNALATPGAQWELRGTRFDGSVIREVVPDIESYAALISEVNLTLPARLEETSAPVRCNVLIRGNTVLATQVTVPFGVCGDGSSPIRELIEAQLSSRSANPLTQYARHDVSIETLLKNYQGSAEDVIPADTWHQLSESLSLKDAALTAGFAELPWPELSDYVDKVTRVSGSTGLMTMMFAIRDLGEDSHWAWLGSSSEPRLAPFAYPHLGEPYDGFSDHARFLLSLQRQYL